MSRWGPRRLLTRRGRGDWQCTNGRTAFGALYLLITTTMGTAISSPRYQWRDSGDHGTEGKGSRWGLVIPAARRYLRSNRSRRDDLSSTRIGVAGPKGISPSELGCRWDDWLGGGRHGRRWIGKRPRSSSSTTGIQVRLICIETIRRSVHHWLRVKLKGNPARQYRRDWGRAHPHRGRAST